LNTVGGQVALTLDTLAARFTEIGDTHAGVQEASMGWGLPHAA
jgi:hypothetical protein